MLQIRAELMNTAAGQEARHRVLSEGDKQLQEALKPLRPRRQHAGPAPGDGDSEGGAGTQTKGM